MTTVIWYYSNSTYSGIKDNPIFTCTNSDKKFIYCETLYTILPLSQLLQKSKKCSNNYSPIYHAMSQWVLWSEIHLSFWHNVKKSMSLKFKIISVTCRFKMFDVDFRVVKMFDKQKPLLMPLLNNFKQYFSILDHIILQQTLKCLLNFLNTIYWLLF